MRVLMVEDDPVLADLVLQALADEGHHATHEPSPERAITLAETLAWDAFILDAFGGSHLEPGEDYKSTLRRFAARAPVIVTTGRAWATVARAEDLGAAGVFLKPYDLEALLSLLQQLQESPHRH